MAWPKGVPRSEETKKLVSKNGRGKSGRKPGFHLTDEQKFKISLFMTGKKWPGNSERMKGNKFNLGRKQSDEQKQRVSERMKGNTYRRGTKLTEEHKQKCSVRLTGKKMPLESVMRGAEKRTGVNHYNYGKSLSEDIKIKLSIALSGENNPNWKGGLSTEPYCIEWNCIKDYIKERDDYSCMNPLCNKRYNKIYTHHINYIKRYCAPENLISLCNSCNSRANYNRNAWQALYQLILNRHYNYQYLDNANACPI